MIQFLRNTKPLLTLNKDVLLNNLAQILLQGDNLKKIKSDEDFARLASNYFSNSKGQFAPYIQNRDNKLLEFYLNYKKELKIFGDALFSSRAVLFSNKATTRVAPTLQPFFK
jgi:hypothetical protein